MAVNCMLGMEFMQRAHHNLQAQDARASGSVALVVHETVTEGMQCRPTALMAGHVSTR